MSYNYVSNLVDIFLRQINENTTLLYAPNMCPKR